MATIKGNAMATTTNGNGNGAGGTFTAEPTKSENRVFLFDGNGKEIRTESTESAGAPNPFHESYFDVVGNWFSEHGPAIGKLVLIIASFSASVYNSVEATHLDTVMPGWGWLMAAVIICAGCIVEGGFAFSWGNQGTARLAGPQIETNKQIFRRSRFAMLLDIMLTLSTLVFGLADVGVYWMMFGQPIVAVSVVNLYFRLKGEHPYTKALQQEVTYNAHMKAMEVWNRVQQMKLIYMSENHAREMERVALEMKHTQGLKYLKSGKAKNQIKAAMVSGINLALGEFTTAAGDIDKNPYVAMIGEGVTGGKKQKKG